MKLKLWSYMFIAMLTILSSCETNDEMEQFTPPEWLVGNWYNNTTGSKLVISKGVFLITRDNKTTNLLKSRSLKIKNISDSNFEFSLMKFHNYTPNSDTFSNETVETRNYNFLKIDASSMKDKQYIFIRL